MAQLQALRAEGETDREEMRSQIRSFQAAAATPTSTSASTVANEPSPANVSYPIESSGQFQFRQKPTLPDPPKFDGTRKNFRPWFLEMKAKLALDRKAFTSEAEQFAYVSWTTSIAATGTQMQKHERWTG
ncbi:hypothetical protein HIM_09604 [Hirsutella minnesotensis 3608]|uniref:Uncharacterized protein n=1 Tax=Hirsutella minnesotensis 3608 TaxID=1043627 RepID=A0A0F7ZS99_9HYPO|nr:hypothetical protein HIM_09604 [Hirsutella minnesotensis 3608]